MATINAVNTSLSGQSGTGAFVGSVSPTITTPTISQITTVGTATFTARSANTTTPFSIQSGTGLQHTTNFAVLDTAASRTITLQDADGTMAYLADRGYVLLSSSNASSSASLTFTNLTGYANYVFIYNVLTPSVNATELRAQVSADNGSTWVSATASYAHQFIASTSTSIASAQDQTLAYMTIIQNVLNVVPGPCGSFTISGLNTATRSGYISLNAGVNTSSLMQSSFVAGYTQGSLVYNAVKFFYSSGNITSGTISVYGVK